MYTATIIIFILTYLSISATNRINKTLAVLIGACAIIFLNVAPFDKLAGKIDLNVIFMLMGMMIIGDIFARTGLFEWISIMMAKRARGNGLTVVMGLLVATAVASAIFNNVITLFLMIPVTILLAQILELPVVPILVLEALFANIGGTATLIGDPCNFIVSSRADLTFNAFILNLLPVVVVIGCVWLAGVALFKGRLFFAKTGNRERIMKALPEKAITDPVTLRRALLGQGIILAALVASSWTSIEPGVIMLMGAVLTGLFCRLNMRNVLQKVDWPIIMFYGGLFVIIGSLELHGVFTDIGQKLLALVGPNLFVAALVVLWGAALLSMIIDNIPLMIAMVPLVKVMAGRLAEENHIPAEAVIAKVEQPLYWALILGIALGGVISVYGSSTNFAVNRLAARNKYHLGIVHFTAYGFPMAVTGLLISSAYLYFRYF